MKAFRTPGASPNEESAPGRRCGELLAGKYRIVRLIGEGGMGQVYEAEHATVGRRFAVKFLRPHLASNEEAVARFRREARAAGALDSEHIATVTDFDVAADGSPFLVMEYLEGKSLGQLLAEEGPLPVPRAAGALLQVCRGLEAAHAAGILHRDLKPDNLFVVRRADGSERVKILDFGIAKLMYSAEPLPIQTGGAIGTPFYMAPEQARGDKAVDERVDVYALGVILYELLSGEKPHPGDCGNAVLAHVLTKSAVPLATVRSGLPPPLVELVHRALAFEPRDRPPTVRALGRELEGFVAPEILRVHAQFELRSFAAPKTSESNLGSRRAPVSPTAPTLPTPDSHSLPLPSAKASVSGRRWLLVPAALLASGLALALFRMRPVPSTDSAAATRAPLPALGAASKAAPRAVDPDVLHPSAFGSAAAKPSAVSPSAAPTPPPAAERPGVVGRPRGRPTHGPQSGGAPSRESSQSSALAARPAVSGDITGSAGTPRRRRFDAQNPYD
jgi:eukaryotic-like serine/threonine-protein kinase